MALLEQLGLLGIEVKGGQWQLLTPGGWVQPPNPLSQLGNAAMGLRDTLGERLNHKSFIVPVPVFPDMEPDQDIEDRTSQLRDQAPGHSCELITRILDRGIAAHLR